MIADFSLPYNHVALPIVRPGELFGSAQVDLGNVARKEEIEGPVGCHPHFAPQPRHLGEIHRSPQEPCKKSCYAHSQDASHRRAPTDTGHLAYSSEPKRAKRFTSDRSHNIFGAVDALPHGVLSGRGRDPAPFQVWDKGCVSHRPKV